MRSALVSQAGHRRPRGSRLLVSDYGDGGTCRDAHDRAWQTERARERAPQREGSETAGPPCERERDGGPAVEHAQHRAAGTETHDFFFFFKQKTAYEM